ncbi:MAG: glycogen debranching enzyme N-terminal domain-containing protein [Ktedonobacteraceae bacterium]|nr:glycogen debranching enzyme N-terminal domain-containing protein [Ktedonobacteraceae bacterium]
MPIIFDRSVCCDFNETISREWLVTNNRGGYAAGTVAGVLTRKQHGLLVAQPPDTTTLQLLLAKIDEEVVFDQRTYNLGTNEYRDSTINPSGFVHLETFRLEEGFPIFTYRLGGVNGIMLEKRIWMPREQNTTFIQYRLLQTTHMDSSGLRRSGITGALSTNNRIADLVETEQRAVNITLLPFVASRPYDQLQSGNGHPFQIQSLCEEGIRDDAWGTFRTLPDGVAGCRISGATYPFHIIAVGHSASQATFIPTGVWYWNFLHRHDTRESRHATDAFYLPGVIRATLWPDEDATLTIIVSTEDISLSTLSPDRLNLSYKQNVERQRQLFQNALQPQRFFGEGGEAAHAYHIRALPLTTTPDPYAGGQEYLQLLLQSGNRFIAQRALANTQGTGKDILFSKPGSIPVLFANYYEMENRTRDALIALPGLTLVTERYDDALRILHEVARHFKDGLLPDRLPVPGQSLQDSDYGSADTTLWFFYALDCYLQVTRNYEFLEDFYSSLATSIHRYIQGTFNGIYVDADDGLLNIPGKGLTWMNAVIDGVAVTPRAGKPIEVNALWYLALSLMVEWSQYLNSSRRLSHAASYYQELLTLCKRSLQQRFWYDQGHYLYDVVDGPDGDDASLRPNQLLALSLRHSALTREHRQSVFDVVTTHLLSPYGLRTLSPQDPAYRDHIGQSWQEQQRALHQGSAWPWLLGPYTDVMLMLQDPFCDNLSSRDSRLFQEYLWRKGLLLLEPFEERFREGLLGMTEGVFDGDPPHSPAQSCASATGTGELLRVYNMLARMQVTFAEHMLSPR